MINKRLLNQEKEIENIFEVFKKVLTSTSDSTPYKKADIEQILEFFGVSKDIIGKLNLTKENYTLSELMDLAGNKVKSAKIKDLSILIPEKYKNPQSAIEYFKNKINSLSEQEFAEYAEKRLRISSMDKKIHII